MTEKELWQIARRAAETAYAPYSRFRVGAALLTDDGTVYTGINIENASFGATVCAERTALFHAVKDGSRRFAMLAVAAVDDDGREAAAPPCGICRQTLSEFCGAAFPIVFGTAASLQTVTLSALLPCAFSIDPAQK